MNGRQRHEYEYILNRLDDADTDIPIAILREALQRPKPAGPYHWIEGPTLRPPVITPRLLTQILLATLVVVLSSLLAAIKVPLALIAMPLYILYCAGLVLIRIYMEIVEHISMNRVKGR